MALTSDCRLSRRQSTAILAGLACVAYYSDCYGIRRVFLFGSAARGQATQDSDIDMLLVKDSGSPARNAAVASTLEEELEQFCLAFNMSEVQVTVRTQEQLEHDQTGFAGDIVMDCIELFRFGEEASQQDEVWLRELWRYRFKRFRKC